jgi:hypothetical protein
MSAEEFVDWQGYLRRHPRGFNWDNWVQASIVREIHKSLEHRKGYRIPGLKDFLYRPPTPLFDIRERAAAEKKRRKKRD